MADETKLCTNCKRDISTANFVMHEMHCRRHIVLCEHCGEPVHRSDIEQHFSDLHAKIPCEKCRRLVSKSDMTKHLAEECSKKLMKCEYCELSLPKNELEAHLDYCGSRTECCPLCKEYIMQKDMLRHESSGCTYPEPRSQPIDAFSMGELQQLMTHAVIGNKSSAGINFRKGKSNANRKSELNSQRAKNVVIPEVPDDALNSVPPDVDYDTMLALQLAHEDWLQDGGIQNGEDNLDHVSRYLGESNHGLEDFNEFIDDGSGQWSFLMPFQNPETAASDPQSADGGEDEDMSIPCEFCETEVPLSFYIAHVESCPQALERRTADLNNEQVPVQQINNRATIPVINNLRPSNLSPEYNTAPEDEDVMLPCEFCQETFPSDMIIHHQNVCQADGVLTPRATTPTRLHRNLTHQQPSNQMSFKQSTRSPPKQQKNFAPLDFVGAGGSDEYASEELTNVQLEKINESSSNKYSPAYNRFDEAITRPPRRSTRQHSLANADSEEPKRESRSVQRARASLNQLLQENTSPEVAGGTKKKPGVLDLRHCDINRTDPRERRSKIDSRTVMRHLEENKQKQTQGRMTSSQNAYSSSPRRDQAALPRGRQRADHVFSPELRLKPKNSPPQKKQ